VIVHRYFLVAPFAAAIGFLSLGLVSAASAGPEKVDIGNASSDGPVPRPELQSAPPATGLPSPAIAGSVAVDRPNPLSPKAAAAAERAARALAEEQMDLGDNAAAAQPTRQSAMKCIAGCQ
jgi:hypothetical protein